LIPIFARKPTVSQIGKSAEATSISFGKILKLGSIASDPFVAGMFGLGAGWANVPFGEMLESEEYVLVDIDLWIEILDELNKIGTDDFF